MALKKQACKNHPDRQTARRCYYCKDYICTECQSHREHHLFCGYWCFWRWKWQQWQQSIPLSREGRILAAIFLGLQIVTWILMWLTMPPTEQELSEQPPKTGIAQQDSIPTTQPVPPVTIDTVRYGVTHGLQIHMDLAPYQALMLIRDQSETRIIQTSDQPEVFSDVYLQQGLNHFVLRKMDNRGRTALVDSFTIRFDSPRLRYLSRPITAVQTDSKWVALTFDGGWQDNGTEQILDILQNDSVRSTLFLTGMFMKSYPQLVQRMVAAGHEIGNHTYSHPHLTQWAANATHKKRQHVNRDLLHGELKRNDSLFQSIAGRTMAPVWRAPYGEYNSEILKWAAETGFKHVGWSENCDTFDWVADTSSPIYLTNRQIFERLLTLEKERGLRGKIILMHLGSERQADFPYNRLPAFIDSLKARGYLLVTVTQMLNGRP
ncbi:MAG: polysaccharide deacetylase family protein [Caldithrix sp.]|nr:polysaccharide deacetylase family protein [Caldithrix sp.]